MFVSKVPVEKGWSGDKKYMVVGQDGKRYLLRTSPAGQHDRKKREHEIMVQLGELNIPMCRALEFGVDGDEVYSVQTWIDGRDAEEFIPTLPSEKQYAYGLDAGGILQQIHSIPAPADQPDWATRFNKKMDRKIKMYQACPLKYENQGGERMIEFIEANRHLLEDRPQTLQHGDYHIGNMMIDRDGILTVIDFNRFDYGDPWEEFNRIVWCAQASPIFATGLVDGYFNGSVPEKFWRLLAMYICSNTLSSLPWAIPFGQKEIDTMTNQAREILNWYNNMTRIVPKWYQK